MKEIKIQGARVHNLKNIDVTIPKNKLIVSTGVSGSGKSSLAYDIIFQEGRRQYLQALGVIAGMGEDKNFNSISGLSPTIAVEQNIIRQSNPRSTVGSRTNILGMLGILYSGEGDGVEDLDPSYFSYNAPNGMCLECSGRGSFYDVDIKKLASKDTKLKDVFLKAGVTPGYMRLLERRFGKTLEEVFEKLPDEVKDEAVYGSYTNGKRSYSIIKAYENSLRRDGEDMDGVYRKVVCPECNGFRIGVEAREVYLKGKHIGQLGLMTMSSLTVFLKGLMKGESLSNFGKNLTEEIIKKIDNLNMSRLGHLSLYREMPSLSGGEIQRLFLNSHIDSNMDSLIYIFDEPTIGLHESEKEAVLKPIAKLKDMGNTVILVEHDARIIKMADHIIDMGPKAGVEGGGVVYQGDVDGLLECEKSLTGKYLSGKIPMPTRAIKENILKEDDIKYLTIKNSNSNNLKDISVSIPLGVMVGIAGVSGSGKSSLISDTLIPLLKRKKHSSGEVVKRLGKLVEIEGTENIDSFAEISQAPIGRNMSSNPATYIGLWDKIRKLFASQESALEKDFTSGHFSFNREGACKECGGSGQEKIWLGINFSIDKICESCNGKRFNEDTLSIRYRGKNIYEILEMTVSEAIEVFSTEKSMTKVLHTMEQIGMGYIKLGQPTPTLSGGEAQRIKLTKEIAKNKKGHTLYILDEPTTGLSLYDISKLIILLDELVRKGNTVIVIEHDLEMLKVCDWIIELGPEGGDKGGYIIAEGSPKDIANNGKSVTGRYL